MPNTSDINAWQQPVGLTVAHWQGARRPERTPLAGQYCTLEPLDAGRHATALFAALSANPANWTYLDMPDDREGFIAMCRNKAAGEDPLFYAILVGGEPVGLASYLRIDPQAGSIEVGWLHFSPRLQGTRAATEAMLLMMRQAFALGYRRYEWKCNALNAPSRRAALRLGFTYEGTFRQARVDRGRNRDTAWFSILDHEWPDRERTLSAWLAPDNFDADGRQIRRLSELRHDASDDGVRQAGIADLALLAPLFHRYRLFYRQADMPATSDHFLAERMLRDEATVFLAFHDGQALGFTLLYPLFSSMKARPAYLLNDLFVAEEGRGKGLGRALLKAATDWARTQGACRVTLSTAHDNHAAQSLYRSCGWKEESCFMTFNYTDADSALAQEVQR